MKQTSEVALAASLIFIISVLARAWYLMILIGVLHAETGLPPRTVGYWISVPIAFLLYSVVAPVVTKVRS